MQQRVLMEKVGKFTTYEMSWVHLDDATQQ